jgi:hypothetical protein
MTCSLLPQSSRPPVDHRVLWTAARSCSVTGGDNMACWRASLADSLIRCGVKTLRRRVRCAELNIKLLLPVKIPTHRKNNIDKRFGPAYRLNKT